MRWRNVGGEQERRDGGSKEEEGATGGRMERMRRNGRQME